MNHMSLVVVGCGNMGRALMNGMNSNGLDVHRVDPGLSQSPHDRAYSSLSQLPEGHYDILLLAVKPQSFAEVERQWREREQSCECAIVFSIMAGVATDRLQKCFPSTQIVRVMPNMPALMGEGAAVYFSNESLSQAHQHALLAVFQGSCPLLLPVQSEEFIDVVTALAGSGPAFLLFVANALAERARHHGLDVATARQLILQTMKGTAIWGMQTGDELHQMIAQVCSKGGTTEAGIEVLKEGAVAELMADVLDGALLRATQMRQGK